MTTNREPVAGWLGNMAGPGAFFLGIGLGVVHCSPYSNNDPMDVIPADFVTNSIIASTWDLGKKW